jgi:hypothetical protein
METPEPPAPSVSPLSTVSAGTTNSRVPLTAAAAEAVEPPPPPPPTIARHRRYYNAVLTWIRGPDPPIDVAFTPIFGSLQEWPSRVFVKLCKRQRNQVLVLVPYLFVWLLLFVVVVHYSRFADEVDGEVPLHFGCSTSLW